MVLNAMEKFVSDDDPYDFLVLCGAAGTGKTSITSALLGYLGEINTPYKIAAPTGRAARILGKKANALTSTIHSMIYIPSTNSNSGTVSFSIKEWTDQAPTVYIIDEASMIPAEKPDGDNLFKVEASLLDDLIAYIKKAHVKNKIIFLGDQYQLPPIGEKYSLALQKEYLEQRFNL
jgi:exodeoxyribonuclease-5